jgi:hypothetical protein
MLLQQLGFATLKEHRFEEAIGQLQSTVVEGQAQLMRRPPLPV